MRMYRMTVERLLTQELTYETEAESREQALAYADNDMGRHGDRLGDWHTVAVDWCVTNVVDVTAAVEAEVERTKNDPRVQTVDKVIALMTRRP